MSRTIVVAGVGEGLGSSAAAVFAEAGDAVALLARSESYLTDLAATLSAETDGTAAAFPTDLTARQAVAETFEHVRERFGPVDALVFTAFSTDRGGGGVRETTPTQLRDGLALRVHGLFACASEAVADMQDGGTVVVVNTPTSRVPSGNVTDTTARHACRGLTRSIAAGDDGVQAVHVVVDGWIAKPSLREQYPDHDRWMEPDEIATTLRRLVDAPETVHASELDLRHPDDDISV